MSPGHRLPDIVRRPGVSVRGSRKGVPYGGPSGASGAAKGADGQSDMAGTLCEAWALSCDDESLFDNVMVIIRWRAERTRRPGRSLDGDGNGMRTDHASQ
ncbi:hypothetical protein GCM10010342_52600 [Streptomyces anulatus]|nr:hypothetical protein GCM10010342_52600 [Streptomyces anulatus]